MTGRHAARQIAAVLLSLAGSARLWVLGMFSVDFRFSVINGEKYYQDENTTKIFMEKMNATCQHDR